MNGSAALERRYRRLLVWFPAEHRREYAQEMIGVLLASAPEGRRRPRLADAFDLMTGGLRARLRRRGAGLSDARWPDALAVCSVALPVTLLAALAVNYLWNLLPALDFYGGSDFYLPALALALPPLIALRYRRTAAVAAFVAAAWFWFLLLGSLTVWIDGLEASPSGADGAAAAAAPGGSRCPVRGLGPPVHRRDGRQCLTRSVPGARIPARAAARMRQRGRGLAGPARQQDGVEPR